MTTTSIRHKRITQKSKSSKKNTKTERKHTPITQSKLLFAPKQITIRSNRSMPISNPHTISRCKFPIQSKDKFPCKFVDTVFENMGEFKDYTHSVKPITKPRKHTSIKAHYDDLRKNGIVVNNKRKRTIKYTPIPSFSQE